MKTEAPSRNKHAKVACLACKQRRSKCDEGRPCANCLRTGGQCTYNQATDARRKMFHKQAVEDLQAKIADLEALPESICAGDTDDVLHIIRSLRAGVSVKDTLAGLQDKGKAVDGEPIPRDFEHERLAVAEDHCQQFLEAIKKQNNDSDMILTTRKSSESAPFTNSSRSRNDEDNRSSSENSQFSTPSTMINRMNTISSFATSSRGSVSSYENFEIGNPKTLETCLATSTKLAPTLACPPMDYEQYFDLHYSDADTKGYLPAFPTG